jgi:tetratricopeptide (TPR) repeat protein
MWRNAGRLVAGAAVAVMLGLQTAAADDLQTCQDESGDAAIAACTRVIASGRYSGDDLATLYGDRGVEYGKNGELDRAIADFEQAIKLNPQDAGLYNNRGLAWKLKGELDRAIADEDQAIKLDPTLASAFYNRGLAWNAKGDLDRAIASYDQAITLDPNYSNAYYNRARALEDKKDLQRALADFRKFAELVPADPDGPAAVTRVTKALKGR